MTRLSRMMLLAVWMAACAKTPSPDSAAPPASTPAPAAKSTLLEGVVRNAAGEPVAEAWVSLVSESKEWDPLKAPPAARVRTSADGRFRIEGAPAGGYALNVTAPGLTTSYRLGLKLEAGQPFTNQEVRLEPKGVLLQGVARKRNGTPVPEAWVGVARVSNDQGDIAYTRADAKGAWSVQLAPGDYSVYTEAGGLGGATTAVALVEDTPLTQDVYLDSAVVETPPSAEVVELLKKAAVPLRTVEAGNGFEDLRPMAPWVSGARIVALGEATHGSREFFQLKHRMLEWLATEHGFTVFGIEANFAEALAINDYVLTGKGDPGAALAGLYFWTWDTEEVLAMIRWMRAYNADPKHTKKLKFYGFDMQYTPGSHKALQAYLKKVDPALAKKVEAPLAPLSSKEVLSPRRPLAPEIRASLQASLAEIQKRLESQSAAYVKKSSARDHAFAVRHAALLVYLVDNSSKHPREAYLGRDRIMAENVRWLLEQEGPEAKMVAWAHNGHVTTGNLLPFISLGRHLRETLKDSLYVFGFAFNQGSFQALSMARRGEPPQGLITHTVPPARPQSLDASLASVGLPVFALNIRGTPPDSPLGKFFGEARWSRHIGAVYSENFPDDNLVPAEEFDGLLFVEKISASTSTPTGRRPPPGGAAPAKSTP